MAGSGSGLVGQLARVWGRVGDVLRLHSDDDSPGTPLWLGTVRADAEQAQRNDDDREYVLVRRQQRIRRARDAEARWAEELALAAIEAEIGKLADARARAAAVIEQGTLPEIAESIFSRLVGWIADTQCAPRAGGVGERRRATRVGRKAEASATVGLARAPMQRVVRMRTRRKPATAAGVDAKARQVGRLRTWGYGRLC